MSKSNFNIFETSCANGTIQFKRKSSRGHSQKFHIKVNFQIELIPLKQMLSFAVCSGIAISILTQCSPPINCFYTANKLMISICMFQPLNENKFRLAKSRYDCIDMYISECSKGFNDLPVKYEKKHKEMLMNAGGKALFSCHL